mmetsp:Transcript_18105/g.17475  ORF Transcript_18105/g.17475 Transcript_18105/m.17475 type:complete len:240 (-) Transcript_18105:112-831(-)|eukprot:CAMPEP_0197831552 /NCGR_PEP_ID=MMETSP1437-20131217/10757_1 /TAXON_ID=49252 ORGANISM="Eucampia antarctica, Strain CCMP1452" /NCGR_SAMPLE_ID=MMETSP1437 /ASSEMBLY_ACC=CAM_ASM_001096 /LENGTH=239 /DNA_ID=CAMNT_0043434511 /DNA_START=43 /DNA_END=762 /DNA_ORIENTATION=+
MATTLPLRISARNLRHSCKTNILLSSTSSPLFQNVEDSIKTPCLIQTRTITKTKQQRILKQRSKAIKEAMGKETPKSPNYIPKDTPMINAISREERLAESVAFDKDSSTKIKLKLQSQEEQAKPLRFRFSPELEMSDKVRKLLDLTNGCQSEVVKAQKAKGMELFQLREGDTGSSAVQVIALTTRIQQLQTHFATHKKDKSGKRGLDALYVRRRKVLDYMEKKEFDSYRRVVKTLGLIR